MATFAAAFRPCNNGAGVFPLSTGGPQAIDATSTVQNYPLGTRINAKDPILGECEFVYAKGVASTAAGEAIQINADFTTTRSATPKGHVGIAMSANVANQYGWYMRKGRAIGKIAADFTAGAAYMSATAGTLQSTAIVGSHIVGMMGATGLNAGGSAIAGTADTTAASTVPLHLEYPYAVAAV